jgi:hypothetical protein
MLDKFILCVFEGFKDTLEICLLFKWIYCLRKTLLTMKSIVEMRETLTLCVRVKPKNTLYFCDKWLKLFSRGSKNQKWSDRKDIFFSLLNLQSVFIYTSLKWRNKQTLPKRKLPVKGCLVSIDVGRSCDDKFGAVPLDGSRNFGFNRI